MRLNGGVLAALPLGALSQVITVTHTRSTCAAIYTTGTSYVTVIQSTVTMPPTASSSAPASGSGGPVSTVTVSPVPSASASALSDAALNAGTPFVISIAPATYGKKRQSITGTYLDANGYTTTNASQAVEYRIVNGTLQAVGGGWVSTYLGVLSAPFAVNATLGPINTLFFAGSLSIQWNNTSFDNGAAEFYTVATGDGRSQVVVRFNGPVQPNWAAVKFAAAPTVGTTTPPASSAVASMSVQTIISMGSMTIPYTPPVSSGPATSGPASSRPASSGPATIAITSTVSAAVSSGVVQIPSSTTANVQPQGSCGASRGGFNCYGAPDGNCCSEYGFCGSGPTYCGAGCQVGYGECDQVVVSSSALPSSSAAATGPGFSSGAPVYSSSAQSSIPIIPVSRSSSAAVSSAPASSIPVAITSSLPPVYSTTWSVTVSNGVSITNTVVYTSTPVSVSTSWSLPVYTTPGQPIGPDNPITWTSSASATVAPWSSSATASSSQAAPSYGQSSVFISSAPVASFAASSVWSSVASAASSVASAQSSWQSAAQSSSAAPAYSSAASVQSSIWSSVQSAAQSSVWSVAQSSSMPAPAYSSMQSAIASSVSSARSSAMSSAFSSVASVMSSSAAAVPHITTTTTTTTSSSRTSTANAMTGTPSVCPTYNGQVYVDWTGGVFTIACGSDYNGDAQNGPVKNVASFEACLEWCDTLGTVCNAVVFDGGNGVGNCYIKPNPGSFVASSNANVNAAQRYVAPVVSSSLAASSSAAAMTSSMMSIPVYPSSAPVYPSSTVAQPAPSPSGCSTVDGTVVTDTMGGSYQISCNHDTDGDGVSVVGSPVAPNSWADCMNACDSVSTCLGFTYLGTAGTDGVGSGVCYLKGPNSPSFETASDSTLVSGIKTTGGSSPAPPASSSMAASSAAPSSIMEVPSSSAAAPSSSAAAPSSSVVVPPVYSPTLSSSMDVPPVTSSSPAYSSPAADVPSSTVPAAASSTSASCAADASAYLVLPCPTQCSFTNGDGTIPFPDADNDDSACEVDTPQPLQIYGQSFSKTYPSSNGIMGIGTLTSQYQPDTMPNADLNIPAIAVMWTDQIARGNYASPQEGAFYQFDDAGVTYEWYLTQGGNPGAHYHYTVRYNYANPGVYIYTYYDVGDGQNGNPGLVGMQGFAADGTTLEGFTYSLDTADIAPGLVLTCDTNANVCTKST